MIYIVDKSTLEIKQKIRAKPSPYSPYSVLKFMLFNDKESGKNRILMQKGCYGQVDSVWELKKSKDNYVESLLFFYSFMQYRYEPSFNFFLTGENKGVSTWYYYKTVW